MAFGDKIEELQRNVATLTERLDNVIQTLDRTADWQVLIARELADFRRETEREFALLKREVEEFKKWKVEQKKERDERDRRWWSFGPNVVGAVVNGLVSAVVAYLVARR